MRFIVVLALLALPVFFLCGFRQPTAIELSQLTPSGYKAPSTLLPEKKEENVGWEQKADGALAVSQAEEATRVEEHPTGLVKQPPPAEAAKPAKAAKAAVSAPKKAVAVRAHRGAKLKRVRAKLSRRGGRRQILSRYQ